MMKQFLTYLCFSLIALTLALPSQAKSDLISNSGFQDVDGDGAFGDGWGSFGAAGFNAFFGPENPHASLFSNTDGNSGGVFQTGIVGIEGTEYTFTLTDVFIETFAAADFSISLEFFEADDATIISAQTASFFQTGDAIVATAPPGTAFVRPVINFSNASPLSEDNSNAFVFNTSLTTTAVPEPSSLLLFCGLLVTGSLRRRRSS
jgi:hypothetical protein